MKKNRKSIKINKTLMLLQVLILVLIFVGCGTENTSTGGNSTSSEQAGTETSTIENAGSSSTEGLYSSTGDGNASLQEDADVEASDHFPEPGESLAEALDNDYLRNISENPPVLVEFYIDHGGPAEVAKLTDSEEIAEFIRCFSKVRIEEETQEMVTDNYNGIYLTFDDGETVSISLNLKNLERSIKNDYRIYILSDFDDLWNYMNEMTEYPEE